MDLKKIEYLEETKELIKQAIIDKGGAVADTDTFRSYVDKINELKTAEENKLAEFISVGIENITESDLEGITEIRVRAFASNTVLKSIEIPNTVTTIGGYAFNGCTGLTEIEIPSSVISIGVSAFNGCSNLEKVIYKGQVPSPTSNLFWNCTKIMLFDFRNCTSVPSGQYASGIKYATGCKVVIPDSLYDSWTTNTTWKSWGANAVWVKASEYVEG